MVQLVHDPYQSTPSSSGALITPPTEVIEPAFILALFGWANEEPSIPTLLTCSACFRRLGLWLFKHPKRGALEDDNAMVSRLDVVGEHRDYCPWVNKESQGHEPGWKALWKIVGLQMGVMGVERRIVDFYVTTAGPPASSSIVCVESTDAPSAAAKAAAARARALSTPVPGAAITVGGLEHGSSMEQSREVDRAEQSQKNESRLKRLKTVYFGGGKKKREEKDGRVRSSSLVVGLGRRDAEKT